MDVESRLPRRPPAVDDDAIERMDFRSDGERVEKRGVVDVFLDLRFRLRGVVNGGRREPGENVSPAVVLPLPNKRADQLADADLDAGLLEHLTPRSLFERLGRL